MILEKPTEEEIEFYETCNNPIALSEILFSNFDNLIQFDNNLGSIWLGQYPLFAYDYLLDKDKNQSEKEFMELREGSGTLYCSAGRNFGKSLIERLDIIDALICCENEPMAISSFDAPHVKDIFLKIIDSFEYHSIVSEFRKSSNKSTLSLQTITGNHIDGINTNVRDTGNAGKQWFQKHVKRHYMEESSMETQEVEQIRINSTHSLGCVNRFTGMTNYTRYTPAGKVANDPFSKKYFMNISSYINPQLNEQTIQKYIKEYGGEKSAGFKIFILGQVVEDGISFLDMERIRNSCYPKNKNNDIDFTNQIKKIEIDKKDYDNYSFYLIVDRPINSEGLYISADIGDVGGITEIGIFNKVNDIYNYLYNIRLTNLTDREQLKIFQFLYDKLRCDFMSFDATNGNGRSLYNGMCENLKNEKQRFFAIGFNEKCIVGWELDDKGNPIIKNGKPQHRLEYISEWSVRRLMDMLYSGKIQLKFDYNLDKQLNSLIAEQGANGRTLFSCLSSEDHLFQMLQVFSMMDWYLTSGLYELKPIKNYYFGGTNY